MADKEFVESKTDSVPGHTKKLCQPCSKKNFSNVADVYCLDCEEYQCHECSKVHEHFSVISNHNLLKVDETTLIPQKYDMKGLDKCQDHGKTLKFLCEDEDLLCCSTCAIGHRTCKSVVEVETKAARVVSLLPFVKEALLQIYSEAKEDPRRRIKPYDKLKTDANEIIYSIQEMQERVNQMFENLKRSVAMDISEFEDRKTVKMKQSSLSDRVSELEQTLFEIDKALGQGTPAQQFILSRHLKKQIRQLREKTNTELAEIKEIVVAFIFDESLNLPPEKNLLPGKLMVDYVTNSPNNNTSMYLLLLVSVDLKEITAGNEPFYTGMDFMSDGRLVAVDNKNKTIVVYSKNLQPLGSTTVLYHPLDVAIEIHDQMAITSGDECRVYFYEVNENCDIVLMRSVNVASSYSCLSVMDTQTLLAGTCDEKQPLRVVTLTGEEKELEVNFPVKTYDSDNYCSTYIVHCNKIVLSERKSHTVYIYDILNNTKEEVKDKYIIKEPRGVAVGPGDSVLVCSRLTNSLVQISHTGQILFSHLLDMKYPYTVCVSKDNTKLVVSNALVGSCKLQLYSIGMS